MYAENRIRELRRELERQFFRGNLPSLTISVICMLLLTGVNLVTAWLMQRLVDVVASNASGVLMDARLLRSGGRKSRTVN